MLCIFNPEHDLCLANGGPHFVAPASALAFAREGASIMQLLYPGAIALAADQVDSRCVAEWLQQSDGSGQPAIVPWGWNIALVTRLLKAGVPRSLMPDDATLARWRTLQHRSTLLPLQPDSHAVQTPEQVEALLAHTPHLVLKAPWSGSGRGLRWVSHSLTPHDRQWILKTVASQQCVVAEPRRRVVCDFALEYYVENGRLRFEGYSLFESEHGVYRANLLLPDDEIARRVGYTPAMRERLEGWLADSIAPCYEGPLGVDHMLDGDGNIHVGELNLRHTMGLVAHRYLAAHPGAQGHRLTLRQSSLVVEP